MLDDAGCMWQPLLSVGVEESIGGQPVVDETELPRKVGGVTDARTEPLAEKRWHLVGGVTGDEDPSGAHRLGNRGVEPVHDRPDQICVVGCDPPLQQLPHAGGLDHLLAVFSRLELELPAPVVGVADDVRGRSPGIADLLDEAGEGRHRSPQPDVENQPVLVVALVDERQPETLADPARRAVGGDEPASAQGAGVGQRRDPLVGLLDRGDIHAEAQLDAVARRGVAQERLQFGLVVRDRGVEPEWPVGVLGEFGTDDPFSVGAHELGTLHRGRDLPQLLEQSGVLEDPLDLVVHHDRSWQVVHLGCPFEHLHREAPLGEQQRGRHADWPAADHDHVDVAHRLGPSSGPRNIVTRASACASMKVSVSVSWPSNRASGAFT